MTQNTEYLDIEETFAVHKPQEADDQRLATIADAANRFAQVVRQAAERGDELDYAMKAIREAELWASESILQSHRVTPEPPVRDFFPEASYKSPALREALARQRAESGKHVT